MFFFIYLRKQFRCTATRNLFNLTNSHFSRNKQPHQPQSEPSSIATRSPFHHQSNAISLNKRPYSPQVFINQQTPTTLFICPQTQNKRAKTRLFVSFSPFILYHLTQTSAFSICFPNYLAMQTHP
ncbi:MAG: hypothetical protein HXN46_04980 [Prevotella nanceiensis]|nr:hypothetical protein [Hoylesella nanceiensis]